jgi:hypothetical protein
MVKPTMMSVLTQILRLDKSTSWRFFSILRKSAESVTRRGHLKRMPEGAQRANENSPLTDLVGQISHEQRSDVPSVCQLPVIGRYPLAACRIDSFGWRGKSGCRAWIHVDVDRYE